MKTRGTKSWSYFLLRDQVAMSACSKLELLLLHAGLNLMPIGPIWKSWVWAPEMPLPWSASRWLSMTIRSIETNMKGCGVTSPSNLNSWRKTRFTVFCCSVACFLWIYLLWHASSFPSQVKVMHKQLLLFHNAISAYFAGNQQQLEQTLLQFNVKLKPPGSQKPSWLEEQ